MTPTDDNLRVSFPAPGEFHRVLIGDCGACSGTQHRRDTTTVKVLWVNLRFVDDPQKGVLLHFAVQFSTHRSGRYGRLLASAGVPWTPPTRLDPRSLIGRTLLVRLRYAEHSYLRWAARIIEMQPDYPS